MGSNKKVPAGKTPKAVAAAASSAVDKQGKQWSNPHEWLASFNIKSIKKHWTHSLAGTGFCPICHRDEDKHAPASCPLLAELNLKLIHVSPPACAPVAASAPAASPSPGGYSAIADEVPALGSTGLATAPSGHVATVAEEFDSDNNFHWDSDESGVEFGHSTGARKSNNDIAFYPSCNHVFVVTVSPVSVCPAPPAIKPSLSVSVPSVSSLYCIVLSKNLSAVIKQMSTASFLSSFHCCGFKCN